MTVATGTLLLRGGRVVDPAQGIDRIDDVLVRAARAPANVGREGGPGAVYLFRGGATLVATPAWTSVGFGTSQVNEYGYGLAFRSVVRRPRFF